MNGQRPSPRVACSSSIRIDGSSLCAMRASRDTLFANEALCSRSSWPLAAVLGQARHALAPRGLWLHRQGAWVWMISCGKHDRFWGTRYHDLLLAHCTLDLQSFASWLSARGGPSRLLGAGASIISTGEAPSGSVSCPELDTNTGQQQSRASHLWVLSRDTTLGGHGQGKY